MSAFAKLLKQEIEPQANPVSAGFENLPESLKERPADYWDLDRGSIHNIDTATTQFIVSDLHRILKKLDSPNQIGTKDLDRLSTILEQFKIPETIIKAICNEFSMERDSKSWAIYTKWLTRNEAIEFGTAERELDISESEIHVNRLLSEIGAKYTLSKLTRTEQNKELLEEIFSVEKNTFLPTHRQAVVALRSFYRDLIFGSSDCAKEIRDLLLLTKNQKASKPQIMLLKGVLSAFFEHTDKSKKSGKTSTGWNQLISRGVTKSEYNFLRFYTDGTYSIVPSFKHDNQIYTKPKPLMGSNLTSRSKESLLIYLASLLSQEDEQLLGASAITKVKQFIQNAWYKLLFGEHAPPIIPDIKAYNSYHKELSSSPQFLEHEMIRRGLKEVGGAVHPYSDK
jgi:hypothetical protein